MEIKSDFVNPFLTGATHTLAHEVHQEPAVGRPAVTRSPLFSTGVSVIIGVTGQVRGVFICDMEEKTAKAIASVIIGAPVPLLDKIAESAIAELVNLMTGLASVELEDRGYQAAISPPSVVTGRGTQIAVPESVLIGLPLHMQLGHVYVYVALNEAG